MENDPVTGEPLMLRTAGGIQTLYVYDGLGSPVGLLTDFASVSFAYAYDPYGVAVLTGGGASSGGVTGNPFLFKGGIQDRATGWVHYGNRWYNPTIGRWTQQDTLDAPLDPANANRYAYAGCDPINNTDPTGRVLTPAARVFAGVGLVTGTYQVLSPDFNGAGFVAGLAADLACAGVAGVAGSVTFGVGLALGGACFAISTSVSGLVSNAFPTEFWITQSPDTNQRSSFTVGSCLLIDRATAPYEVFEMVD